ncbi:MAG: endopeptidase La [bacterium]|nr:endopeptidase La [bacterium]
MPELHEPTSENRPTLPEVLPVLPIDNVVFPGLVLPFTVSEPAVTKLVNDVLAGSKLFCVVTRRPEPIPGQELFPTALGDDETFVIGCSVQVLKMIRMPDGTMRLLLQGTDRIRLTSIEKSQPYWRARIEPLPTTISDSAKAEALRRKVQEEMSELFELSQQYPDELKIAVVNVQDPGQLADLIGANLNLPVIHRQRLLEADDVVERLTRLLSIITREQEVLRLGNKLQSEVEGEINKTQREFMLREQMRAIQRELGEYEGKELEELKQRILAAKLPESAQAAADKELERLSRMNPSSADYSVSRTFIDWLLDVPWSVVTEDRIEVSEARKILEADHYGLEDVKERIIEFLSVRKLKQSSKGPILCLVGPPGVGKTSIGRSIARSMGRTFFRFSLGGMRDEAEIRGHRRTYVGALPGRIVQGMKRAGSMNPVFMLDEIDKLGSDFRGDPASALLEVLDPEQNFSFTDHYLEVELDLSKVLFLTTANTLETIPRPLLDRMEVIRLPGYLTEEKIHIASKYLVPRQREENGLEPSDIKFTKSALDAIITGYTLEAGVRNLERKIGTACRKVAVEKAEKKLEPPHIVDKDEVAKLLGPPRHLDSNKKESSLIGVANGLAWTPVGGDVLKIEATSMPGTKGLFLTGQLGSVMKESAEIALSFIRSHHKLWNLDADFLKGLDVHIHIPEGATPKDGPSAGVTMTTALVSLFTKRKIRGDIAMTGEITLQGKVLPIGGLREKSVAAARAGIKTIFIPDQNISDLEEMPDSVKSKVKFVPVKRIEDLLSQALV